MKIIRLSTPHSLERQELPETIAAIGFFDGIHKGHRAVIEKAVMLAKEEGKESAVITFHPHPSVVLKKPSKPVLYITAQDEKVELIEQMGVDRLYIITFNEHLSRLAPEEFIEQFIVQLHITHLVAGFDFTFGFKGAGNMHNIDEMAKGKFSTTTVEKQQYAGEKISSTRIRKCLATGEVDKVIPLLGRPYQTTGKVIEGDKRGRKLGFPTANLQTDDEKLLPKQGVYAVKVMYDQKYYFGMANLGVKPTFVKGQTKPQVEVYIFDFDHNIYGETLVIEWHQYIRAEKKFNGIEEIVTQLQDDEKRIRQFFNIE